MSAKLYPGIAFSPQASLTNNIGAADTIIEVSDVSAFPPAPNLATIGTDEEGETILYAAKTETGLSGCQRGVEGAARAWTAGELIGRNWTAKDHADLIAAISEAQKEIAATQGAAETAQAGVQGAVTAAQVAQATAAAKQNKLTGLPGQVVGFDGAGAALAVRGWSNQNLLDNAYWANNDATINQRGQDKYAGGAYGIDRWFVGASSTLELLSNSIKITTNGTSGLGINQKVEIGLELLGSIITLSFLTADGELLSGTGTVPTVLPSNWVGFIQSISPINARARAEAILWNTGILQCSIVVPNGNSLEVIAAKLELGPVQTLAHKEGDTWILNDPPPNKALELLKCKQYQVENVGGDTQYGTVGFVFGQYNANCFIGVPLSTELRANPVVTYTGNWVLVHDTVTSWSNENKVTAIKFERLSANIVVLRITAENALDTTKQYALCYTLSANRNSLLFNSNL